MILIIFQVKDGIRLQLRASCWKPKGQRGRSFQHGGGTERLKQKAAADNDSNVANDNHYHVDSAAGDGDGDGGDGAHVNAESDADDDAGDDGGDDDTDGADISNMSRLLLVQWSQLGAADDSVIAQIAHLNITC